MKNKIIIYGAGKKGQGCYELLKKYGKEAIVLGFCDKNYKQIKNIKDVEVMSFENAIKYRASFLIAISDKEIVKNVKNMIETAGGDYIELEDVAAICGEDVVKFNRDYCACYHIESMDEYFKTIEETKNIFWDEGAGDFYSMFQRLDLENVIELAVGRGRHVPYYINEAKQVTVVDILDKNIDICKERFKEFQNVHYYVNNGYNLERLGTEEYTSLFCYDAMVHFEMMDIYEYLKDIYRVLVPGGRALLHHSNNGNDYRNSFITDVSGRSFMSKEIFAYLADRVGFKILEQNIIDWNSRENLDCITLIQKPLP